MVKAFFYGTRPSRRSRGSPRRHIVFTAMKTAMVDSDFPLDDFVLHSNGVFLKGALHWLVPHETDHERMIILTLDLASEDLTALPIPFHMFPDLISLKSGTSDLADLISLVVMGGRTPAVLSGRENR
ncbi:unnamed protein product [Prunus armeniaca]